MIGPRLITIMVLATAVAVVSTLVEAKSKRIHVTSEVAQTTFTGDPAGPELGDRRRPSLKSFWLCEATLQRRWVYGITSDRTILPAIYL